MKLKLFAALCLFVMAASTQAANVSVNDITIMPGTPSVEVPVLVTPTTANERVGAMTLSFAAGDLADGIGFNNIDEFGGSIWEAAEADGAFFTGVPGTPGVHNIVSAAALDTDTPADGILITYQLNTSSLAPGHYTLDPNFDPTSTGLDVSSLLDIGGDPLAVTFASGTLSVIPEPSTIALTAIFSVLGLGVYFKRRRG